MVVVGSFSVLKYVKGAGGLPFGGKVVVSFPCVCSANYLLTVSAPMGGQFVYYAGTQGFLNYNLPSPGVWALGLYEPGGVCLVPGVYYCATPVVVGFPLGTITPVVGTSIAF